MILAKDFSFSAVVAEFVTVLVGFTGAGVIVFQAAQALGAFSVEIGFLDGGRRWDLCFRCWQGRSRLPFPAFFVADRHSAADTSTD